MEKPNLTQLVVAALVTGIMMTPRSWADDADTAQLKQQVQELQAKVDQLQGELTNQQQTASPSAYDQYQYEDPLAQMMQIQRQMDRQMRQAFADSGTFNPRMDMKQTDKEYIVTMDIPGMDKNKINVETKDGMLTISGERRTETDNNAPNQYYRQERSFGSFMQAVPLPDDAKTDHIGAKYQDGVLTVTIPRMKKEDTGGNAKIAVQ